MSETPDILQNSRPQRFADVSNQPRGLLLGCGELGTPPGVWYANASSKFSHCRMRPWTENFTRRSRLVELTLPQNGSLPATWNVMNTIHFVSDSLGDLPTGPYPQKDANYGGFVTSQNISAEGSPQ